MQAFGASVGATMAGFGVPGNVSLLTARLAPELNPYNSVSCLSCRLTRAAVHVSSAEQPQLSVCCRLTALSGTSVRNHFG